MPRRKQKPESGEARPQRRSLLNRSQQTCCILLALLILTLVPARGLWASPEAEFQERRQQAEALAAESRLLPLRPGKKPGQWIGEYRPATGEVQAQPLSLEGQDWNSNLVLVARPRKAGKLSQEETREFTDDTAGSAPPSLSGAQRRLDFLASQGQVEALDPAESSQLLLALLYIRALDEGRVKAGEQQTIAAQDLAGLAAKEVPLAGLEIGQSVDLDQLFRLMLRRNAHDAARALGRALFSSNEELLRQERSLAQSLGLSHSSFHSVSGLSNSASSSQGQDLLLLFSACMQEDRIRACLSLGAEGQAPGADMVFAEELAEVYSQQPPVFRYAKTAFDRQRHRQMFLAAYELAGQDVYVLLSGAHWRYQYLQDMQKLDALLQEGSHDLSLLRKGAYLTELPISGGRYQGREIQRLPLYAPQDIKLELGRLDSPERYHLLLLLPEELKAPVAAGSDFGYLELHRQDAGGDQILERYPLRLDGPLEQSRSSRLSQILRWILAILLGCLVPLVLSYLLFLRPRFFPQAHAEADIQDEGAAAVPQGSLPQAAANRPPTPPRPLLRPAASLRETTALALGELPKNRAYIDGQTSPRPRPQSGTDHTGSGPVSLATAYEEASQGRPGQDKSEASSRESGLAAHSAERVNSPGLTLGEVYRQATSEERLRREKAGAAEDSPGETDLLRRFQEASRQHAALEEAWASAEEELQQEAEEGSGTAARIWGPADRQA